MDSFKTINTKLLAHLKNEKSLSIKYWLNISVSQSLFLYSIWIRIQIRPIHSVCTHTQALINLISITTADSSEETRPVTSDSAFYFLKFSCLKNFSGVNSTWITSSFILDSLLYVMAGYRCLRSMRPSNFSGTAGVGGCITFQVILCFIVNFLTHAANLSCTEFGEKPISTWLHNGGGGVKMEVGSADGLLCSSLRLQEHKPLRLGAAAAHFSLAEENMTNSFQLSGT